MQEYFKYITGTLTPAYILAFYTFALMGMIFTLTVDYAQKKARHKKKLKFKIAFWLLDNGKRIIANIIVVFVVLRFYEQIKPGKELSMWIGFITGATIDSVIIIIRKYTTINIFQTKK